MAGQGGVWPVRSLWAWPLATFALGVSEIFAAGRMASTLSSTLLALWASFGLGVWIGVLWALCASFAEGRGWLWRLRMRWPGRGNPSWAVALVAGLVLVLVGWPLIGIAESFLAANPIDYAPTEVRLWRSALLLGLPALAFVLYPLLRRLEERVAHAKHRKFVSRVSFALLVALALHHFSSGPFFIYFGRPLAMGLLVAAAIAWMMWLPRMYRGRPIVGLVIVLVPLLLSPGLWIGLNDPGARALLLHDTKVMPHIVDVGVGWLERDADGDHPVWLGGGDCDDTDPAVHAAMPEIPGNGIDDDCTLGELSTAPKPKRPAPVEGKRPPIILVTIDTVRTDRLELYGGPRETMPALTELAREGTWFRRAYAPANHTFFALTALFAGQSTERMLVVDPESGMPRLKYTAWLPQDLRELGYHTVAIEPPLVSDGKLDPRSLRFDDLIVGQLDYAGKNRGTTSRQIADTAIDVISRYDGPLPLALWVHFMDPHAVHESPVRFEVRSEVDAYDNELSWVDMHLSRIVGAVRGRFGKTAIIVVTSDHGEELGEVGNFGHGFSLRESEIRVPLVFNGPGFSEGERVEPVSTLAVSATLRDALGQPSDPRHSEGSLLSPSNDAPFAVATNPAFLWNEPRMELALVEARFKLVWSRTTNTRVLIDLEQDPGERRNVFDEHPEVAARMFESLQQWAARERALSSGD